MVLRTLEVDVIDGVQVVFMGRCAINDEDWESNLDVTRRHARSLRGVLVTGHPDGPGISAKQRHRGAQMWREVQLEPRIAVLTDSVYQRGVVTAVSWVTPGSIRAFSVADWRAGARFAGAEPASIGLVRVALERQNRRYEAGLLLPL